MCALVAINMELLLRAAEFIDRKDREAEHGYASTAFPSRSSYRNSHKQTTVHKSLSYRNAHNELEKSRRAHQHRCLESLKAVVPLKGSVSRHTTLGLLIRARQLIKHLQDTEVVLSLNREQLIRDQGRLRRQLDMWQRQRGRYDSDTMSMTSFHTLSESSTSSVLSVITASTDSDFFEQDDVDVVFCGDDLAGDVEEIDETGVMS